jgi:holliday junction DNA helicase RuvB
MSRDRIISGASQGAVEDHVNRALRPAQLEDFVGQANLKEKLDIALTAARGRQEPIEHILFHGPPGLGKTTLAHIISQEMGAELKVTSGPSLERAADLVGILTNLKRSDVLFIDEIHRLSPVVEEYLYPAMEDFQIDFTTGQGAYASTIRLGLEHFVLVGATTRAGMLTGPLRERFGIILHLDFYAPEDLRKIILRSASLLETATTLEAAELLAHRSRGTPRVANRLLRRVRDFAQVRADGKITALIAEDALAIEGIDQLGLDDLDRRYLKTLTDTYEGGPAGIEAIAATLNEESDTLEDMVEPYLLKIGFIKRTSRGRCATSQAWEHLGMKMPERFGSGLDLPLLDITE